MSALFSKARHDRKGELMAMLDDTQAMLHVVPVFG